jgi:hypothetical protein
VVNFVLLTFFPSLIREIRENPRLLLTFAQLFSVSSMPPLVDLSFSDFGTALEFTQRRWRTLMFPRITIYVLLAWFAVATQFAGAQQLPSTAPAPPSSNPSADATQQMRDDLNQMESLMNNMQSEINFLRDQNLQILLTTNVRMWTILIRDLRRQLDDGQLRGVNPPPTAAPRPAGPK